MAPTKATSVYVDSWGDRWVTDTTAAEALGVDLQTIHDWIDEGLLCSRLLTPQTFFVNLDGVQALAKARDKMAQGVADVTP